MNNPKIWAGVGALVIIVGSFYYLSRKRESPQRPTEQTAQVKPIKPVETENPHPKKASPPPSAFEILQHKAESGDSAAQYELGLKYAENQTIPQGMEPKARWEQAIHWYKLAANQGHLEANIQLGALFFERKDFASALKYLTFAGEKGDVNSQYFAGVIYLSGEGTPRDESMAFHWLEKAALQGDASAQYRLGAGYAERWWAEKSLPKFAEWTRKSAEQGFQSAQRNLGLAYYHGEGVKRDLVEAYKWFALASVRRSDGTGSDVSEECAQTVKALVAAMNPNQIRQAKASEAAFRSNLQSKPPAKALQE